VLATNRGNNLVLKTLQHRYPHLTEGKALEALHEWLAASGGGEQNAILQRHRVDEDACAATLHAHVAQHSNRFPLSLGADLPDNTRAQLALFLVSNDVIFLFALQPDVNFLTRVQ
jgi:hypothetical protein